MAGEQAGKPETPRAYECTRVRRYGLNADFEVMTTDYGTLENRRIGETEHVVDAEHPEGTQMTNAELPARAYEGTI